MRTLFAMDDDPIEVRPARKLAAKVTGTFLASGATFESFAVDALDLVLDGIVGDHHHGPTRRSGGREPWYPHGTSMRNDRQVSIVAPDELALVAGRMELPEIHPGWIGANLVLDGVPRLSMLPSGTLLFFAGGTTLKVDSQNKPCRIAGKLVATRAGMADTEAGALAFPKAAQRLRGLVAWVEKPGRIENGEAVSVRIPEQWIY